jgi:hypothetical protein
MAECHQPVSETSASPAIHDISVSSHSRHLYSSHTRHLSLWPYETHLWLRPLYATSLALLPSTRKTHCQATRVGWEALGLIDSNSPHSQHSKRSIQKMSKFGERVHAELDIEVSSHKLLRSQVLDKPWKAAQDRHKLTRARLIDNTDIVHLRKGKEAKKLKSQGIKKSK